MKKVGEVGNDKGPSCGQVACPRRAGDPTRWKIRVTIPQTLKNYPQIPLTNRKIKASVVSIYPSG